MPSVKLCPRCNQLPTVKFERSGFMHLCVVSCANLGCPFFYPIVMTSMYSDEKAMQKAIDRWNEKVKEYKKKGE